MPFDPSTAKPIKFDPTTAKKETEFDVGTMVGNIPRSAAKFGQDMVTPILHPVQTANALWNLTRGIAQKTIKGEQPQEAYVDAAGQYIKDRYGSLDALKETMMQDPIGVLSDYSAALLTFGAGASMLPGKAGKAGKIVMQTGSAADPVNVAANTAKQTARLVPKGTTRSMYDSAVKWRTTIPPEQRQRMTDTALREGLPPSYRGVGKMHDTIRQLNSQLDDLISKASGPIDTNVVFKYLDDVKRDLGGFKVNAPNDVAAVQAIEDSFRDYLNQTGKTTVTPAELQRFKTDAYTRINFDMRQGTASYAGNEASKAMARAAKEEIEKVSPEVKAVNERLGTLLEMRPELERAAGRVENKNMIGISEPIGVAAGGALAPGSETAGAVAGGALMALKRRSAEIAVYIEKLKQTGIPESFIQNRILPSVLRQYGVTMGEYLANQPNQEQVNQ